MIVIELTFLLIEEKALFFHPFTFIVENTRTIVDLFRGDLIDFNNLNIIITYYMGLYKLGGKILILKLK